jgi:hypothetical protein
MGFSRRQKRWLGVASVWPVVWMLVFLAGFIALSWNNNSDGTAWGVTFAVIFTGQVLTIVEIFVVVAYYVVWLMKQDHVPDERKTLWVVILLMGNALAVPIFWFLYVLKEKPLAPQPPAWVQGWQPPPPGWQPPPHR